MIVLQGVKEITLRAGLPNIDFRHFVRLLLLTAMLFNLIGCLFSLAGTIIALR
jgi:hypothetical protein